jgi:ATP-dependent Clp protease ATP-binding subunit ClpC
MMIDGLRSRLRARSIDLSVSDEAIALIADAGYDPDFGARPMRRTVQRLVENELSSLLLRESVGEDDAVDVTVSGDQLDFAVRRGAADFSGEPTGKPAGDLPVDEPRKAAEQR